MIDGESESLAAAGLDPVEDAANGGMATARPAFATLGPIQASTAVVIDTDTTASKHGPRLKKGCGQGN